MSIQFSSQEQVKNSEKYLRNLPVVSCSSCSRGILMCKKTPCIGTPEDMERLMDAGHAMNIMLDWWTGAYESARTEARFTGKVFTEQELEERRDKTNPFANNLPYLSPAIIDYGGKLADYNKAGQCVLLVDDKCSVHDIKPIQGKHACCKTVIVDTSGTPIDERHAILHTWNTQKGADVIARWKREVGFTGSHEDNIPKTSGELIHALLNTIMYDLDEHVNSIKDLAKNGNYETREIIVEKIF